MQVEEVATQRAQDAHTKAEIEALAASTRAHGVIQNPVIEPERAPLLKNCSTASKV